MRSKIPSAHLSHLPTGSWICFSFECFSLTFHRRWNALDGTSSSTSTLSPYIFRRNIHMVRRCSPNIIIFFIFPFSLSFIKLAFFCQMRIFSIGFGSSAFSCSKWLWVGGLQAECGNGCAECCPFHFSSVPNEWSFPSEHCKSSKYFPICHFVCALRTTWKSVPKLVSSKNKKNHPPNNVNWIQRLQQREDCSWRVGIRQTHFLNA